MEVWVGTVVLIERTIVTWLCEECWVWPCSSSAIHADHNSFRNSRDFAADALIRLSK